MAAINRIVGFVRDREWVAVVAAVTAAVSFVEAEFDWLATVIDPVPGDNPAQTILVVFGAFFARRGVTSNATRDEQLTL